MKTTDERLMDMAMTAVALLTSLQEFVDYFEDFKYVFNDDMRDMIERAEAVIKKATN